MLVFFALAAVLAFGLTLVWVKRKQKRFVFSGVAFAALPFLVLSVPTHGQILMHEMEASLASPMELTVESDDYRVTLINTPTKGGFLTLLRVMRPDGMAAYCFLPSGRWSNARVEWRDGKAYFLGGKQIEGKSAPCFDPEAGLIVCGCRKPESIASMGFMEALL